MTRLRQCPGPVGAHTALLFFFDFSTENRYNEFGVFQGEQSVPAHRVLILESNTDFAAILRDGLEQTGKYQTSVVLSGQAAVQAMRDDGYDLAIVDAAVSDIPPGDLLPRLRKFDPYLRVVLVPPFGTELDDSWAAMDIQGILYKPFFLGQLDEQISIFIKRKVQTAPPTRVEMLRASKQEMLPALTNLFQEMSAELVALICQDELITCLERSREVRGEALTPLICDILETASRLAAFLGEPAGHFEFYSCVGQTQSLYVVTFGDDLALITVPGNGIPPGVIHLNIKRVVEELSTHVPDRERDAPWTRI